MFSFWLLSSKNIRNSIEVLIIGSKFHCLIINYEWQISTLLAFTFVSTHCKQDDTLWKPSTEVDTIFSLSRLIWWVHGSHVQHTAHGGGNAHTFFTCSESSKSCWKARSGQGSCSSINASQQETSPLDVSGTYEYHL